MEREKEKEMEGEIERKGRAMGEDGFGNRCIKMEIENFGDGDGDVDGE